jgi:O-acetyl-ADP-ribose deacetylase (regulator of RNase III)
MAITFTDHKNYATLDVGTSHIILEKQGKYLDADVDFLVNPAQPKLTGGGTLDGAIHKKAGEALKEACKHIPKDQAGVRCPTGEARLTYGAKLKQAYVVHTVGPKVSEKNAEQKLWNSYHNSMAIARDFFDHLKHKGAKHPGWMDKVHSSKEAAVARHQHPSIAFCSISTGAYGYPKDKGPKIACKAMVDFAKHHAGMTMHFYGGKEESEAFLKAMKKAK